MSRFQSEVPDEMTAREFLAWRRREHQYQAELYRDAIACERRLQPVTTAEERAAVAADRRTPR